MTLGNQKGHIKGDQVTGPHTEVIDGVDTLLKAMARKPWFESANTNPIKPGGGRLAVTVRRHYDPQRPHTLHFTFRRPGSIQGIDVKVYDIETNLPIIIHDVEDIVRKEWHALLRNHTAEVPKPPPPPVEMTPKKTALLELWEKRGQSGDPRGRFG